METRIFFFQDYEKKGEISNSQIPRKMRIIIIIIGIFLLLFCRRSEIRNTDRFW